MSAHDDKTQVLARGSHRVVLAAGHDSVTKEAVTTNGLLQNVAELIISERLPAVYRHVARVRSISKDGRQITMERGCSFADAGWREGEVDLLQAWLSAHAPRAATICMPPIPNGLWALLGTLVRDFGVSPAELERAENWCLRREADRWIPMLVDYGTVCTPGFFGSNADILRKSGVSARGRRR